MWEHIAQMGPILVLAGLMVGWTVEVVSRYDAPTTAKVLPVALDVFALSMILFGKWCTPFTLPRWLGGDGPSPVLSSGPLVRSAWTRSR